MVTTEMVKVYISQLCAEIGCTAESIYDAENKAWYFSRGSASIEVFFSSYETAVKTVRTFVRCFAPVCPLPLDATKKAQLLEEAAQNSARYMGVKLGILPGKPFLFAIAERDIDGMDYLEFKTLVSDMGFWADQMDNILTERYGNPSSLN